MLAPIVALVLSFNDGRAQEQAESAARVQEALQRWPGEHGWTVAGAGLSVVATGLILPGAAFLGVAHDDAIVPGSMVAASNARVGWSLLGFGLTALAAAIGMVVYNAML